MLNSIYNSILLKLNSKTGVFCCIVLKLRIFTHFSQEIVISKVRKCETILQELTMINNAEAKMGRVMLQPQIILQYFYKMLMWPISYWFSSKPTINITFSFTNNHSSH